MPTEHSPTRGTDGPLWRHGDDLPEPDRLIDIARVCQLTSLSRTTIWRLEGAGHFARRRQISPNRVGWLLSEILLCMREQGTVT